MKKLYRRSTVHPTPSPPPPIRADHLSLLLPATLLSLCDGLSTDDRHVLAYLVSHGPSDQDHEPIYGCGCFACYASFWVKWDRSENRLLIYDIIDALEASSSSSPTQKKTQKKERKKRGSKKKRVAPEVVRGDSKPEPPVEESKIAGEEERGSVRRVLSFIGEKIWGVWS